MGTHQFALRLEDEIFEAARKAAAAEGVSLNAWLCEAAAQRLSGQVSASPAGTAEAMAQLADAAGKLGRGWVLVPRAEAGESGWDRIMTDN